MSVMAVISRSCATPKEHSVRKVVLALLRSGLDETGRRLGDREKMRRLPGDGEFGCRALRG